MPYLTETELSGYFQKIDLLEEHAKKQTDTIARLTAGSEAMQEDARNNTATIKAQAEEIRTLKDALLGIKGAFETNVRDCEDWIQYQNVRKALTGDK